MKNQLALQGCTPEPLMNYLKSLGILRLISEDAEHGDTEARGAWQNGIFYLRSRLTRDGLAAFFLDQYRPTPILAPWNGGCGFYKKWDAQSHSFKNRDVVVSLERIAMSSSPRFEPYRKQIATAKRALAQIARPIDVEQATHGLSNDERKKLLDSMLLFEVNGQAMNLGKANKDDFLAVVRSSVVGEETLLWLDAAIVLLSGQKKNRREAPVLGSGGNVGNSDFSAMFMQATAEILPLLHDAKVPANSSAFLKSALFGETVCNLPKFSIGQFDPGMAGGANSTHGTGGEPVNNPWDYVLMLEGCLSLGGAVTRRLGASRNSGVFPFVVRSSSVGYGSAGVDKTRGEIWLPLWSRFASVSEICSLLGEGRADISGRRATTGVGFARAVASLGVDRGIESFVRYEFQERLGQSYLATPLGRFEVRAQPAASLLRDADAWLDRFRQLSQGDTSSPRLASSLRIIDRNIFEFCRYGTEFRFADIIWSLGRAERELALCASKQGNKDAANVGPLAGLSSRWLTAAADGSAEFDIACSLAAVNDRTGKIGGLRSNLEPVVWANGRWNWATKDRRVVWNNANLSSNLAAILGRRVIDCRRAGSKNLPIGSPCHTPLSAISRFLAGQVDDQRLEGLLWGLIAVDHTRRNADMTQDQSSAPPLPRAYALLKLLFLHSPIRTRMDEHGRIMAEFARVRKHGQQGVAESGLRIACEPEVLSLLGAGRLTEACGLAMRRLRVSGFLPLPHRLSGGITRDSEWEDQSNIVDSHRLAAALLFPISSRTLTHLIRLVTRPSSEIATSIL
ncbi:MAG TPA: type I-U CRISPR-associated protein Csx17 [Planctomycetaceae bacterium]|jgi:CRISPR-associated protein Csx17